VTRHVVGRLDALPPGTAQRVDVDGTAIAVVRCGEEVFAVSDVCSHANVSLSEGEVLCADREIECWKHGSTFSLVDGEPQSLPATRPVAVFKVEVDDGQIVVTT
jgi:3-phenylpropionate/trans-cinnamate dioxygenase ferredoxin component